jgi:hypothetical protein
LQHRRAGQYCSHPKIMSVISGKGGRKLWVGWLKT